MNDLPARPTRRQALALGGALAATLSARRGLAAPAPVPDAPVPDALGRAVTLKGPAERIVMDFNCGSP